MVTAEITCSPLRVLTGQGPSLDRSAPMAGHKFHAQAYDVIEDFIYDDSHIVRPKPAPSTGPGHSRPVLFTDMCLSAVTAL